MAEQDKKEYKSFESFVKNDMVIIVTKEPDFFMGLAYTENYVTLERAKEIVLELQVNIKKLES